ncbi:MAG: IS1595 family transposase [Aliifodinibius sp.]|nr:IS1595 family transposase [Fodinibius sp.]
MYQSIDFFQFQKRFATEKRCMNYLIKQRWPNGFVCPKCTHDQGYFIQTRALYQCKKCDYQASVTAGTIFHKTRTPLRKWFWMIFLLSQNKSGYSVNGLREFLNITLYKTAWFMAHKIRKALADRESRYKLAGIIEMDDSYFGQRKATGKRGRGADKKAKVIISVQLNETEEKPIFASMTVVERIDKENITNTAEKKINSGSIVKTDGWPAYNAIKDQGLKHFKIVLGNQKNASELLPWVHILIANCKAFIRGTHHGVSTKHLQRYLSEFCYRFNRRFWQKQIFERMIHACLNTHTITISELMV